MRIKKHKLRNYCSICRLVILEKDNYCRLTDYKEGKFWVEAYYHNKCFSESLRGGKEMSLMKQKAYNILNRAEVLMSKAEG